MIPEEDIPKELLDEWKHAYLTSVGMICGDKKPTHEQHMAAMREATEHVEKIAHGLLQ